MFEYSVHERCSLNPFKNTVMDEGLKFIKFVLLEAELLFPLTELLTDFLRKVLHDLLLRPMHYWRLDAAWRTGFAKNLANSTFKNKRTLAAFATTE
jgi:hypothetical protein